MAQERVSTPTSSAGVVRFYDITTGGPQLDARAVLLVSVVFILIVKLAGLVIRGS